MADDELVDMSSQFRGLPIADLIGAPLKAACDAQKQLAKSIATFIEEVGFLPPPRNKTDPQLARQVSFNMTRPNRQADGSIKQERVGLSVPVLSIVPIPNLQVSSLTVDFEMTVQSQFSNTDKNQQAASIDAEVSGGGPFGLGVHYDVKVHGEVAHQHEQTRSGDSSAKYRFHVEAKQQPPPEGLMKVLDILNTACAPTEIKPLPPGQAGANAAALPAAPSATADKK